MSNRARTPFIETEALLIALDDGESERLFEYLAENFTESELYKLQRACRALSWTANDVISRAVKPGER